MKSIQKRPGAVMAISAAVAVGVLALSGCSSTNSTNTSAAGGSSKVSTGTVGTVSQFHTIASVCGSKKVTVGVVDGYGTNAWSKTVKAEIQAEAAKCPSVTSVQYAAGAGSLQATTSAVTSMAAKGDKIILVIPDAGPGQAQLSALRTAHKAGATVVPFASDPTGTAGTDYLDYTDQVPQYSGKVWAEWMVKQLGSAGGNVVFLGGPAGNNVSSEEFEGAQSVLKNNPQVKLLNSTPITTNWDPAAAQTAMSGLLSKYSKIDGVITDYGASADGVIRAYQAANKQLVPITATDENSLSCGYTALKASNPNYELATVSSRTWIGRVALRKALAAYEGKSDTEPSLYNLHLFEDSTGAASGSVQPSKACIAGAPADAPPSTLLTPSQISTTFGN